MGDHDSLIEKLSTYAQSIFRCNVRSIHGIAHWKHVDRSGQLICRNCDADLLVVRFFAFWHDCHRHNDRFDRFHGPRAADALGSLPVEFAILDDTQIDKLEYAIRHHTDGNTSNDPTIGACWDSDRLDLGRVGIIPHEKYMSTEPGKEIARLGSEALYKEKLLQLPDELQRFIAEQEWTFAKTYADTYPHEYIVEERVDLVLYAKLAYHIDTYGYTDYFYQKPVVYFDYDGYTYWHMENIINRCVGADTYHRRKQDGRLPDTTQKGGTP